MKKPILILVALIALGGVLWGGWTAFRKVHFEGLRKVIVNPSNFDLFVLGERNSTVFPLPMSGQDFSNSRLSVSRTASSWQLFHQVTNPDLLKGCLRLNKQISNFYGPNGENLKLQILSNVSDEELFGQRWKGLDVPEWWNGQLLNQEGAVYCVWECFSPMTEGQSGRTQGGAIAFLPSANLGQYVWWSDAHLEIDQNACTATPIEWNEFSEPLESVARAGEQSEQSD